MKMLKKWICALALTGASVFGTSCGTDLRDAALTGVLDYVTGTTTGLLAGALPIDDGLNGDE